MARTLPATETVLTCQTCGEASFGNGQVMVFPLDLVPGSLFACSACQRWQAGERRCRFCGRFMRRVGGHGCPEQRASPELEHVVRLERWAACPVCAAAGNECRWFTPDAMTEHLAEHEEA